MEYSYKAIDRKGTQVSGQIGADNEGEVVVMLTSRQLTPIEIKVGKAASGGASWQAGKIRRKKTGAPELALALRELATLLTAGVSLVEAIENLTHAHQMDPLGDPFKMLGKKILAGEPFSHALAHIGLPLPDYVILLAKAGEMTGKLGQSIQNAADQMEYDNQIKQEARNALVYPSILVLTGLAAVILIFLVVVPKFASLLNNPRAQIPELSVWVLSSGLFFRNHLWEVSLSVATLAIWLLRVLQNPANRHALMETLQKAPVIGSWIDSMTVARWSSVFSVLIENRVAIIDAMEQAKASSRLSTFTHKLELAQRDVKAGKRLAESLELHNVLDPTSISMIRVGERTGELSRMLGTVSRYWTDINRNRIKRLLTLLEPLTILIIGVAIGIIMVAIMLAIASLSNLTT